LGSRESYDSWLAFGRDMIDRGLRAPALVIADGAPGIWKATRELWATALEQRCTVHALRNVTGKLPERHHQEVKARWWKAFDDARSPSEATRELHDESPREAFVEVRRRTKVIGRFPGETSALSLIW